MPDSTEPLYQRYVIFARFAGLFVVAAGAVMLFGWALDLPWLKSLAPGWTVMKADTALCFILTGISLRLKCIDPPLASDTGITSMQVARSIGAVVALFALLTLIEYLANVKLGIDQLLFTDSDAPPLNPPGRMAPLTAANFVLLGSVLALCNYKETNRVCEWFTVLALFAALIALLGYFYSAHALYHIGRYVLIASNTALLFVILACGVLASRPTLGFMRALTSPLAGGISARRILPWILLVPVLLGGLLLWGQRAEIYRAEFGFALFTLSNMLVLVTVVYLSTRSLNVSDTVQRELREREQRAEQQRRASDEGWRLAVTNAGLGAWHAYADRSELEWSDRCYERFGMVVGTPVSFETGLTRVHPDERARVDEILRTALRDGGAHRCEFRVILSDGSERWIAAWGSGNFDTQRQTNRIDGVVLDITERKRAEQLLLGQNQVLRLVASGASLPDTLNALLRVVEAHAQGLITSILLVDASGTRLRHAAAPTLPAEYCQALGDIEIGPNATPCGTAAYRQTVVRVSDIQTDPLWADYRELAARFGLHACWSTPIINANGRVLGTFAMYYRTPMAPEPAHEELITFATQTALHVIEHQHAVDAIRASETRYRTLGDNVPDLIARYDRELRFVYINRAIETATGIAPEQLLGKTFAELGMPQAQIELWSAALRRVFDSGQPERIEFDYPGAEGTRFWEGLAVAERDLRGEIESVLAISHEVTARKLLEAEHDNLEAQLRQSHKLQALGTLAGGIAHDFNNMLMVIGGNATLAHTRIPGGHPLHNNLSEIETASARAADLVKRILAFSRPQDALHTRLQLRPIIEDALHLLRSTIPTTIEMRTFFGPGSSSVIADATQVHQVIMNLGTNAAHAMRAHGGTLEVRLEAVTVDAALVRAFPLLHLGAYERVTVTDTGTGMDAATLERIFDPFYTTKGVGEGSGLGLSVVHGIMLGHGGAITVTSRPLKGATFSVYFPAAAEIMAEPPMPRMAAQGVGLRERVLLVDDEESLVLLLTRTLEQLNFRVSGETDPTAALAKFSAHPQDFDVLITDLAMPGMSGFDLVRAIRKIRPALPVIVTTGYIRPEDVGLAHSLGIQHLILKPNTIKELGQVLQRLFDTQNNKTA